MAETYYEVLGVDADATRDDIESAYRERVLETHPDHSDDSDAASQFRRVTTAKSVLTDGTERARYDRLGHDAYVGLTRNTAFGCESSVDAAHHGGPSPDSERPNAENGSERTAHGRTSERERRADASSGRARTDSSDADAGRGPSHHARQRSRRRYRSAQKRAAGEWPFGGDRERSRGTAASSAAAAARNSGEPNGGEGFRYSVHDWDGEVDLEWRGPSIDQPTAVTVASVVLLYPLFVAASLTPLFSVPVNVIVAACTLALIGFLLTMPRIATAAFGIWSVLFPLGLVAFSFADPLSVRGLLVLAFAWIPLGHACALWWTLRP